MTDIAALKAEARKAAFARRKAAHDPARSAQAAAVLLQALEGQAGKVIAGYFPIRTEVDPTPALEALSAQNQIVLPVIQGEGQALLFRQWTPGCQMMDGPFGAKVPADGAELDPQIIIVPLVAFDATGGRLGYGGGFYDRTLAKLQPKTAPVAVGFAYAAQQAEALPREPTDIGLDMIVTERGVLRFA